MVRYVRVRPQVNACETLGKRRDAKGFTLVELLVVIAIIGILVALLLPAIQAAREAARRSQCVNNLKQLSLGALNHESALKQFPSAGFGYGWVGDPNLGSGRRQPGGWIYNTLPYIEEQTIHDMGSGVGSTWNDPARKAIFADRASMTIKTLICPTRRSGGPYSKTDKVSGATIMVDAKNQNPVTANARSDYAGNIGNGETASFPSGPGSYEAALDPSWEAMQIPLSYAKFGKRATGVFTYWDYNRLKSITDGLSKTYCIGEKNIRLDSYENGWDGGDDQSMYCGLDRDNLRWARGPNQVATQPGAIPPLPDGMEDHDSNFGSAHSGVVLMGMCDGSVQSISYDIDPAMHGWMGNKRDGEVINLGTN